MPQIAVLSNFLNHKDLGCHMLAIHYTTSYLFRSMRTPSSLSITYHHKTTVFRAAVDDL